MKYSLLVSLLITVFQVHAQTTADKKTAIGHDVAAINTTKDYKKVILQNEEFLGDMTDGGGELTGYFKNQKIEKITEWIGVSNGVYSTEFYFKNEQLIFVYRKFSVYEYNYAKNEFDWNKKNLAFEGRYYFVNSRAIDKIEKELQKTANSGEIAPAELLEDAKESLEMLYKKTPKS